MILVAIVPVVSQNEIGSDLLLQSLENRLDLRPLVREKAISKLLHDDSRPPRAFEKHRRAAPGFPFTGSRGRKDHPIELDGLRLFDEREDKAAATDFNIVRMRAKTENAEFAASRAEIKRAH
jgi:hypothetical protein